MRFCMDWLEQRQRLGVPSGIEAGESHKIEARGDARTVGRQVLSSQVQGAFEHRGSFGAAALRTHAATEVGQASATRSSPASLAPRCSQVETACRWSASASA